MYSCGVEMPWVCGHGLGLTGSGALRDVPGARRLFGDCACEKEDRHILSRQGYIDGGISNKKNYCSTLVLIPSPLRYTLFQICFEEGGDQCACLNADTQSGYYSG